MMATELWRAPSGRLHHMRVCSGGAAKSKMTRVSMSDEEILAVEVGALCRCAWRSFQLARERTGV
jgi:hypothetical protein